MSAPEVFYREVGTGPGVVCLHANASTSVQWRGLMESLGSEYHVLAADSYGVGESPPWPSDRRVSLRDEVALLEPVFERAGDPFALVGHSYGAAVALIAAVTQPHRVGALALFEPVLFALVDEVSRPPNAADGIRAGVNAAGAALDAGEPDRAAQIFIDYWMGAGAWANTAAARKPSIAAAVTHLRGWADALFQEPTPLEVFGALDIPVLYMMGTDSPASSRAVGQLLVGALPQVQVVEFERMGHMGPVTHPEIVNQAITRFVRQNAPQERSTVHLQSC